MRIILVGNHGVSYSSETHHAETLEAMGHQVVRMQEGKVSGAEILEYALQSDLLVFIHTHGWSTPGMNMAEVFKTLKKQGIPTITYHLDLWFGLDRQKDLEQDDFYKHIGHFFTVDKLMADWFNKNTNVKGHFLPAGVFGKETVMLDKSKQKVPEVVFVGSKGYHPEWPYRPQLIDWLQNTYGDNFGHYSGEEGTLGLKRGLALNQLFADTKVVIGDSLCLGFDYPYYSSDRLFETTGRGGFLIYPDIKGVTNVYFKGGKEVVFYKYGDFEQLKYQIDYYLEHDEEREKIRLAGFERAQRDHTYSKRWQEIFKELGL